MFSLWLRRISRKHPLFFFFVVWLGNSTVVVTPVFLLQTQRPVLPSWFPYTPPPSNQYLPVLTCDPCFDMHTAKSFLSVSRQGVDGQSLAMTGMDRGLRSWNLPFHLLGGCIYLLVAHYQFSLLSLSVSHMHTHMVPAIFLSETTFKTFSGC